VQLLAVDVEALGLEGGLDVLGGDGAVEPPLGAGGARDGDLDGPQLARDRRGVGAELGGLLRGHLLVVLKASDVALAGRERDALRQEEVAREARGNLHDFAALAQLRHVALEDHMQCLAHDVPLRWPW